MATIYKCDKCHDEFTNRNDITLIEAETESNGGYDRSLRIKTEICKICFGKLVDFLKPNPEKAR